MSQSDVPGIARSALASRSGRAIQRKRRPAATSLEEPAMKSAVPFLIALWIPFIVYLFRRFPKHRAVIVAFVAGILFLPGLLDKAVVAEAPSPLPFPFLPFTKQNIICLSVFVAAV